MKFKISAIALTIFIIISMQIYAGQAVYEIRSAEFFSEGRTLPYFLELAAEIEIGRQFGTNEELLEYIKDREKFLLNQRVLASVLISSQTGPAEGNTIPVDLKVKTSDTWNIIVLPYFKYDTNTGLLLSLRGRDYDFLGTMEPFRINLNWEKDETGNITWGSDADFNYPFRAFDYDWVWNVDTALNISDTGTDYSLNTGLTINFPTDLGKIALSADQGLNSNGKKTEYTLNGDRVYYTEGLGASISVPLYTFSHIGDIKWTPSVNITQNWDGDGLQTVSLNGPSINLDQSIGFGRVDWEGNFRKGFTLSAGNSNTFNFWTGSWDRSVSFSAIGHTNWKWAGASSKLSGFTRFDTTDTSAGDPVRGVINDRIDADSALFLNLDLPVRVIRFLPSQWFGKSWMRLFDFEQHWSPFIDLAFTNENGKTSGLDNLWYAGGLEIITYPLIMRSFYLRISAGWDLRDVIDLKSLSGISPRDGEGIRELFIGFGHHY